MKRSRAKTWAAGAITAALMALLVASAVRKPSGAGHRADSPSAAVGSLLDATSAGDVSRYLDAFSGPLRDRLGREVADRGRGPFAGDLRAASAARKGLVVFAPEAGGDPGEARVTVESVYPDRIERQTFTVNDAGAGWTITGLEVARGRRPREAFGSPAAFLGPEGPPVPAEALAGPPDGVGASGEEAGADQ